MILMFPIMLSLSEILIAMIILGLICNAVTIAFFAAPLASLVSSSQPERGEGERERDKRQNCIFAIIYMPFLYHIRCIFCERKIICN